jgi:hypothetical protein
LKNNKKHLQTFESFLYESAKQVKAEKLIPLINHAKEQGKTVSITFKGKNYEIDGLLFLHFKTVEFKIAGNRGETKSFKNDDMVTVN